MPQPHESPRPRFIYGTAWKEDETKRLVGLALAAGFRAIDTANQRRHYHEAAVGEALRDALAGGELQRDEIFLQTKFTSVGGQDRRLPYDPAASVGTQVRQSFESSLRHLGVDRIDSYVLHGPTTRFGLHRDDVEAWRAMEALHAEGLASSLGVSNVSREQLDELCAQARVPPAFVQNRCFAELGWDRDVRAGCRARGITYQGFSLLTANRQVVAHPEMVRLADRHGRSPAQLVFRFAIEVGMVPLTGTSDPEHMRADLACLDFELAAPEVALIEGLGELA